MRSRSTAGAGVLDQVVSSAGNFCFVVLVARAASPAEFGAFSLGMTGVVLFLALSRAALGTPLLIGVVSRQERQRRLGDALALASLGGLAGGVGVTTAVWLTGGEGAGSTAVLLGAGAMVTVVQDVCRHGAMAADRPQYALTMDTLWLAVVAVPLVLSLARATSPGVLTAVALWVLGGTASVVLAWPLLRPRVALGGLRRRTEGTVRLRTDLALTVAAPQASTLIVLAVLAAALGGGAVAALRGAVTLMGPINLLFAAMTFAALPALSRQGTATTGRRPTAAMATGLAGVVTVWSAVLLLLPPAVGEGLLGSSWQPARGVLPFAALEYLFAACSVAAGTVLQARGQAGRHARVRLLYSVATLVLGSALALLGADVRAVAAALVLCAAAAAAGSWHQLGVRGPGELPDRADRVPAVPAPGAPAQR